MDDNCSMSEFSFVGEATLVEVWTAAAQAQQGEPRKIQTLLRSPTPVVLPGQVARYLLYRMTEPLDEASESGEAAVAAASPAPAIAAAGLKALLADKRLRLHARPKDMVDELAEFLREDEPTVMVAALDVLTTLKEVAPEVAAVSVLLRCLDLLSCGHVMLEAAALRFIVAHPLAPLSVLLSEQRQQLVADTVTLLERQSAATPTSTAAADRTCFDCCELLTEMFKPHDATEAAGSAVQARCLPVLCRLLQTGSADVPTGPGAGSALGAEVGSSSNSSRRQEPPPASNCGTLPAATTGLTILQYSALGLLTALQRLSGSSADPRLGGARAQLLSAGGAAALWPLVHDAQAAQLLLWLAAAGPEVHLDMAAELGEACARLPELTQRFVAAWGDLSAKLQEQMNAAEADAAAAAAAPSLQVLLEVAAAAVAAQPRLAAAMLQPGGRQLLQTVLACLGARGSGDSGSPAGSGVSPQQQQKQQPVQQQQAHGLPAQGLVSAALRLLSLLLEQCGPPPSHSLPAAPEVLLPALMRVAAADASGGWRQLVLCCTQACIRGLAPRQAAITFRQALNTENLVTAAQLATLVLATAQPPSSDCSSSSSSTSSNTAHTDTLHMATCLLEAACCVPADARADGGGAPPQALAAACTGPAAFGRLAAAVVQWPWLRQQLQAATPAGQQQSVLTTGALAPLRPLHALHAAVAVLLHADGQEAEEQEVVAAAEEEEEQEEEQLAGRAVVSSAAEGLVDALVPFLLPPLPPSSHEELPMPMAAADEAVHTRSAIALQLLTMLLAAVGAGADAVGAADRLLRRAQQRAADSCCESASEAGVWPGLLLLPAAAPMLRGLLPAGTAASAALPPLAASVVAAAMQGQQQGGEEEEEEEGDEEGLSLSRWRSAMRSQGSYSAHHLLQLGTALLSGLLNGQERSWQGSGPEPTACVVAFALGLLQLPPPPNDDPCSGSLSISGSASSDSSRASDSSRDRATAAAARALALVPPGDGWLMAAAADLLRPLAPQLPRPHLTALVRALTLKLGGGGGGSGGGGPLHVDVQLPALMCLAACCDNTHLQGGDVWPAELGASGFAACCNALRGALDDSPATASSGDSSSPTSRRLLKLCARWFLELPTGSQQQQQQVQGSSDGTAAGVSPLARLAAAALQTAVRQAEDAAGGAAEGAAAGAATAAAARTSGATAATACLADCVLAVCDGALPALYGRDPWSSSSGSSSNIISSGSSSARRGGSGGGEAAAAGSSGSTAAAAGDWHADEQLQLLADVLQRVLQPLGRCAFGMAAAAEGCCCCRAAVLAGHWALYLTDRRHTLQRVRAGRLLVAAREAAALLRNNRGNRAGERNQPLTREEARYLAACKSGDLATVEHLVSECWVDVDVRNTESWSALHWAASNGHTAVVEALLAAGADTSIRSEYGWCALHCAAEQGHLGVVTALLAAGADVDSVESVIGFTPLHLAAFNGHTAVVEALLMDGVDQSIRSKDGRCALHCAAQQGHLGVVEALLAAGADVDASDEDGRCALHCAAQQGYLGVVTALLAAGADKDAVESVRGFTPLHWAASYGHTAVLEALLMDGADKSIRSKAGWMPKHLAKKKLKVLL